MESCGETRKESERQKRDGVCTGEMSLLNLNFYFLIFLNKEVIF